MEKNSLFAVIMAGGRGLRFWPKGRNAKPKQLLTLFGEATMLEATVFRLQPLIPLENIIIVTNKEFQGQIQQLLPIPAENVLAEPVGRNTAPCVALAAAFIKRKLGGTSGTMVLLPADHIITPAKELQKVLNTAKDVAEKEPDSLLTIGINPTYPATGYGYIQCGKLYGNGVYKVDSFKEKPDHKTAEKFIAAGNYKWNSGMFVWTVESIEHEFRKYSPQLYDFIQQYVVSDNPETFVETHFPECPNISIDYAILEKAENIFVCEAEFYWNDIGSWSSLRGLIPEDEKQNTVQGKSVLLDVNNSVIINDDPDLMIGVVGMSEIAVVKSGNGLLICPLAEEQKVRDLVAELKNRNDNEYI